MPAITNINPKKVMARTRQAGSIPATQAGPKSRRVSSDYWASMACNFVNRACFSSADRLATALAMFTGPRAARVPTLCSVTLTVVSSGMPFLRHVPCNFTMMACWARARKSSSVMPSQFRVRAVLTGSAPAAGRVVTSVVVFMLCPRCGFVVCPVVGHNTLDNGRVAMVTIIFIHLSDDTI